MSVQSIEVSVVLKKPRTLDNKFYCEFAELYNSLKNSGLLPLEIQKVIMDSIECSRTQYFHYLRTSRKLELITDSFEENTRNRIARNKESALRAKKSDRDVECPAHLVCTDAEVKETCILEKPVDGTYPDSEYDPKTQPIQQANVDVPKITKGIFGKVKDKLFNFIKGK